LKFIRKRTIIVVLTYNYDIIIMAFQNTRYWFKCRVPNWWCL